MSKALVKFVIFLVVLSLVYSVFWFFKAGQVEKQVNGFVSKNSNYISVGEVSVSGFPLVQKITIKDLKFTIPGSLLGKRQVVVKHLEAKASISSQDFVITLLEPITLQDSDNNATTIAFNSEPEISVSIGENGISKFDYKDSGYKISDTDGSIIYAAESSVVSLEVVTSEADKMTSKIAININGIEGFNVIDVYKNVFEKKVTDGLKTGELVIGSPVVTDVVPEAGADDASNVAEAINSVNAAIAAVAPEAAAIIPAPATEAVVATQDPKPTAEGVAANALDAVVPTPQDATGTAASESAVTATPVAEVIKNNFSAEIEYSLVSSGGDEQASQTPTDPTQILEVPANHNKVIKIASLEFSNPKYKISINGEMSVMTDDNLPSGSVAVKVEKIDNLVADLATNLTKILDQKKLVVGEVQSVDLVGNVSATDDSYQNFLNKFSVGLAAVSKEVAAKNAVSKDEIAEFDIRREKNLEFLVNETPIREILGKF